MCLQPVREAELAIFTMYMQKEACFIPPLVHLWLQGSLAHVQGADPASGYKSHGESLGKSQQLARAPDAIGIRNAFNLLARPCSGPEPAPPGVLRPGYHLRAAAGLPRKHGGLPHGLPESRYAFRY